MYLGAGPRLINTRRMRKSLARVDRASAPAPASSVALGRQPYLGTPEQRQEMQRAFASQDTLNQFIAKYSNATGALKTERKFSNLVPANLVF